MSAPETRDDAEGVDLSAAILASLVLLNDKLDGHIAAVNDTGDAGARVLYLRAHRKMFVGEFMELATVSAPSVRDAMLTLGGRGYGTVQEWNEALAAIEEVIAKTR